MARRSRDTFRPVLWVVLGLLAVVAGGAALVDGLTQLDKPHDLSRVGECPVAFADGCVTRRSAVVLGQGYAGRGSWLTGERRYHLDAGPVPGLDSRGRLGVELDRQSHRDELTYGREISVVFYGRKADELDVGGYRLLTQDHPTYAGPDLTLLGLAGLSMGLFAVAYGWPAARAGELWKTTLPPNPSAPLAATVAAALVAWVSRVALGSAVWAVLVPLLVGVAVALSRWRLRPGRHERA